MFKNIFQRKRSKNKKKEISSSVVNKNVTSHADCLKYAPSASIGSLVSANPDQRSPSPTSQSDVLLASNQSGGIATTTEFGPNANFAGANAIAFGTHSTATYYSNNSYHIRFGDQELTETQVEDFMAGILALPENMATIVISQSSTILPRAMAAHNDYMPRKERVPCFKGTREALLKEIGNWFIVIGTSKIYVLSGLAGIGKSTIAYTVAKKADRLGLLGASFFFSRKEAERRTAEKFFTTIAFQLCTYDAKFAHAIEKVLATHQGKSATTKDPEIQLNSLIIEPLQDLVRNRSQPVVIVVDALDECEKKDAQMIVKSLGHLVNKIPSFKVLLTTRPQPHFDHLLSSHDIFFLHNIEDKIVNDDIRSYLKFKLSPEQVKSALPTFRTSWNATGDDIDSLVQAAGKLFIIASTSVLFILDETVRNPGSQMKKLRSELARNHTRFIALSDFYSIILNAVVPPGSDWALVKRFQKVVGAIALLYNPLPVNALARLIDTEEDDIYGVLDNLRSVIFLGADNIPYIYHKSLSDWITDTEYCKNEGHYIDPTDCHTWLTIRCLQTMNKRLKRNMFNIDGVAQFMRSSDALERIGIKEEILQKITSELKYACIYWTSHLNGANFDDADLVDRLTTFANNHWLHWMEVWGWLSSEITFSINNDGVHKFMQMTTLQELHELLSDGLRFFFKFHPFIKISALFPYHSAMPFTPTESLFYQRYKKEMVDNICRVNGGPKRWDAFITSDIHGLSIDRVMFSDGRGGFTFASCSTEDIKFWNQFSGSMLLALNGDRTALSNSFGAAVVSENEIYVELRYEAWSSSLNIPASIVSIALSADNRRLAVALCDGNVTLAAVEGLKQISVLQGFGSDSRSSYEPCHLAFSPNSDKLAYRLAAGGAVLRKAIDGEHIADLNYKSMMVHRLVFSPNGYHLASLVVEDDLHVLTLWNCTDGKFLEAIPDVGSELAFSPDGSLIATGGSNNAVKLWSRNNEDQNQGLCFIETPHLSLVEGITCLAFSHDGMLAIGSANNEIILYDVSNCSLIATIPFRKPTAIAFSHDSTRIGAGNADGIFRLLDIPTIKASAQTSQERSAPVSVLVFSPDCSRLVSGSENGIIQIWDTSCTNEPITTCGWNLSKITTISFTPSGSHFASGDANGSIKLWSSDGCALSDTIQWPISGELTSVAVTNCLLACATKDSIALWDLQKSHIIGHLGECGSMHLSLSNDDENLLLASFDGDSNSVAIWNVGSRTLYTKFNVDVIGGMVFARLVFCPDDSQLLVHVHEGNCDGVWLFDVANKMLPNDAPIGDLVDHGVFPSWKGIPVWMSYNNFIMGWFSQDDGSYIREIVCKLPEGLDVVKLAFGSSMFALFCKNGSLLLLQSNEGRLD